MRIIALDSRANISLNMADFYLHFRCEHMARCSIEKKSKTPLGKAFSVFLLFLSLAKYVWNKVLWLFFFHGAVINSWAINWLNRITFEAQKILLSNWRSDKVNNGNYLVHTSVNRAINYFSLLEQKIELNQHFKFCIFRSVIDEFSTSNEVAQWSRRRFLLPIPFSRAVLRESAVRAMECSLSDIHIFFLLFCNVSFMFAI